MKTLQSAKAIALVLAVTLAGTLSFAHADDPKPKRKHHAAAAATDTSATTTAATQPNHRVKGADSIPTRDDRNSREVTGGPVGGANGPEYRVQTGSQIPRHYNRRGYTTDSDQNSFIYDKNDQRLTSHNNVGESLRQVPGLSVSGSRNF